MVLVCQVGVWLTRRGRNMQLAETFVCTLTPCILQSIVVFLTAISTRT